MALALPCTSCGRRLRKYNLFFKGCTGYENIQDYTDEMGNCVDWVSMLDAESNIQKVEQKKAAAIQRLHAPLTFSPFRILKR